MTAHLSCPTWQQPPDRLDAADNMLDVWRILLPAEGQREASHAARSSILRRYLAAGQPLAMERHPGGKPFLAASAPGPEFNLSHTRDLALLAVSPRYPVGVDLERIRPIRDPLRIARRVLPEPVTSRLAALDATSRSPAFLCQWTRFEATQKSVGRGVFDSPIDTNDIQLHGFCPRNGFVAFIAAVTDQKVSFRYFDFTQS